MGEEVTSVKKRILSLSIIIAILFSFNKATLLEAHQKYKASSVSKDSPLPAAERTADHEGEYLYISDLDYKTASVSWGTVQIDTGLDGPLKLITDKAGTTKQYDKGICAHAASKLEYNIDGMNATRFQSFIGVNYEAGDTDDGGTCEFIIKADNKELYKSGVLSKKGVQGFVDVKIPAGTKTLALITTNAGDGEACDHSIWAEPKLYVANLNTIINISLDVQNPMLSVGGTTAISLKGDTIGGKSINIALDDNVTFQSDNQAVATVSAAGVITAVGNGTANITCSVNMKGNKKMSTIPISVSGETWTVKSPNERASIIFQFSKGMLSYCATQDGAVILRPATLGIKTSLGDFSQGLVFKKIKNHVIDETYSMISGKKSTCVNRANETTLTFSKGNMEFDVIARAYDDGVAFRYAIRKADGSTAGLTISEETSVFAIPTGSGVIAMPNLTGPFNHEGFFSKKKVNLLSGDQTMPLLYNTPAGTWTLLTEADLNGTYTGSVLKPKENGTVKLSFPSQQQGSVISSVPFVSPWRLAISGTLEDIVESTMVQNVSPDNVIGDTSWIQPGVTAWTWMTDGKNGQRDPNTIKKYIDFAHEMGWKYLILDEGWQPDNTSGQGGTKYKGYFPWFYDIIQYAKDKNIGLIAWVLCNDLNTPEKRKVLKEWADIGIKGIKADFFDRESQDIMKIYSEIYKVCAENHLIANLHGSNKPTGEVRTYPHILNREAIRGEEYNNFSAQQTTIQPFTRGVVGPTDITPRLYPANGSNITVGQQIAMCVVYESGIPCMASSVEDYRKSPALSFYKDLPAAWDDIHYINGNPGEFITLARKKGTAWYAASITNKARDAVIPLNFLKKGITYSAMIYHDGAGKNDVLVDYQEVTADTVLTVPMSAGGGCAVKITQDKPKFINKIYLNKATLSLTENSAVKLVAMAKPEDADVKDIVWTSSDPKIATVDSTGTVVGVKAGNAIITVASKYDANIKAECKVHVDPVKFTLLDRWSIIREEQTSRELLSTNAIKLTSLVGDLGEHTTTKNLILTDAPQGDFSITVKVSPEKALDKNFQTIALTVYANDTNLVSAMRRYHSYFGGNCFELFAYENGYKEQTTADVNPSDPAYLKLERKGNVFKAYYSLDNVKWNMIGNSVQQSVVTNCKNLKIGIYASNGDGLSGLNHSCNVVFEDFTCNGKKIPFAAAK